MRRNLSGRAPPAGAARRRPGWRAPARVAAAGLLLLVGAEAVQVFLGRNFHAVIPGRVYRCNQPTGRDLKELVLSHGIRTVVNLRGCGAPEPWYLDECRAAHAWNVSQEDVCLSAYRLPPATEVRRLVEVLERSAYPLVLHCRQGADRTGLASALVVLLQTDCGLPAARRQLGLRYGHVALGRTGNLDRFLDLYADWLAGHGLNHSREVFRRWVESEYCPGECRCVVEALDVPARVRCGEPIGLRVRCHNTSPLGWRLRPDANAGVHAGYRVFDEVDGLVQEGRAGLFDAEVPPGEGIDLKVVLHGLKAPGRYRVLVDMVDEQQGWFFQAGSEPLEQELEARE